jgi:hypothetical protein
MVFELSGARDAGVLFHLRIDLVGLVHANYCLSSGGVDMNVNVIETRDVQILTNAMKCIVFNFSRRLRYNIS